MTKHDKEKLSDLIPYRRTVWVKNFAKTVTTTTLVSSGIGFLITGLNNSMTNNGFKYVEVQIGVICLIVAIIISMCFKNNYIYKNLPNPIRKVLPGSPLRNLF